MVAINPISHVSFKGEATTDKLTSGVDKATKVMSAISNLEEGADEFKKNVEKDKEVYKEAVTNIGGEKVAKSKVGQVLANIFGGFIASCTNLAGAATSVSSATSLLGE
jgi:hypothetical protein